MTRVIHISLKVVFLSMNEITFGEIVEADLMRCSELFVSVFNAPPWNDKWASTQDAFDFLSDFCRSAGFVGVKAEISDKLIGCIFGNINRWWAGDEFFLHEMFVDTKYHNRKVGTRLINRLRETLRFRGVKTILLMTHKQFPARGFYEVQGFSECANIMCMVGKVD